MVPTQEQMAEAFHWFTEQPEGSVSVHFVASKFGINYEQLRGALALHGKCPPPKHAGKQRAPAEDRPAPTAPRGRPKAPVLPEELQLKLRDHINRNRIRQTAHALGRNNKWVLQAAHGQVGVSDRMLKRLNRIFSSRSRAGAPVDDELYIRRAGNRAAQTAEIVESLKKRHGGHYELNNQGEKIWIPYK